MRLTEQCSNVGSTLVTFLRASLAVATLVPAPAFAQTDQEIETAARDAFEMAQSFAECAGYWDFMSALERELGNTASAANAHNIGNGARLSAGYTLSIRHRMVQPHAAPRAYGSWDDFIEPLAEVTATRMLAAAERNDLEEVREQGITCAAMGETAQEIVDRIRADRIDQ